MNVTTTSTSTATLDVPYICRCAYCGAAIQEKYRVSSAGYAFTGGYATQGQGQMMNMASGMRANRNMAYELEYEEKLLAHYRDIVSSGKLKAYFETGKKRKADRFRVEAGSALETYLKSKDNKTKWQVDHDNGRLTAFPYSWKDFDKSTAVKCPQCGKSQPWCEDVTGEGSATKAFFLGAAISFLGLVPFMAGLQLQGGWRLLAFLPLTVGVAAGIWIYRRLRRKRLDKLAAMPWNAEDLPRFDEAFLAKVKAELKDPMGGLFQ